MLSFCVLGVIVFSILSFVVGLHKETKFRTKKALSSGWFLFITLLFLLSAQGDWELIRKGFLLGIMLSIPFCIYEKRWIDKRIKGTTREQRIRHQLWGIPVIIVFLCFWKQIVLSIWPSLGFFFALFSAQLFTLFYAIKLEKTHGLPILEDEKK